MVTDDLQYDEVDKRQRKTFQHLDDPPLFSLRKSSCKNQKVSVTKNPKLMPQITEINERSSSFLNDKSQLE